MLKSAVRKIPAPSYLIFFAIILLLPLFVTDAFWLNRLSQYLTYGMLAAALSLCWGYCGILSLGHAAFFGLGAYCMAMSLKLLSPTSLGQGTDFPLPDFMVWNTLAGQELTLPLLWVPFQNQWFGLFAALIVPLTLAILLGLFIFYGNISGVFVSIVTLSLVVILNLIIVDQQPLTNGFNGITDLAYFTVGNFEFDPYSWTTYLLTAVSLIAMMLLLKAVVETKTGLLFRAIQADETRVKYFGYNIANYKLFAFSLSALVAGLAGALFTISSQFASPALLEIGFSISIIIWTAVGGRASLLGSAIGAIAINLLQSLLSESETLINVWLLIIGSVFILVILVLPNGLTDIIPTLSARFFPKSYSTMPSSPEGKEVSEAPLVSMRTKD
ncbi:urea ABC transporter permease subunit UrtC [Chroococcidiopsis sp. TS-821]|uniref:urea ABC transporter permease subunit UrtC n=1 Tax=Chroococcidiopsis sp. TS-821 TaxID=1378066 RepID=UPI000CEEAFE9|nr:urea ABC transporter permease subunit UrtC [Chroococcidiopsis sp. TS-821]PPS41902.1 urea ABC transporter permease subunit UrtC [Chroococcidiopsis sp. TS-821]